MRPMSADPAVRAFLLHENPAAAGAIAERFAAARRRGLWHPRRNAVDDDLASADGGGAARGEARGRCPTLAAPMLTGDGWLVRLRAGGGLTAAQAAGLAAAAGRLGNGRIEVTGRGSLQVRGLTPETAEELGAGGGGAGDRGAGTGR